MWSERRLERQLRWYAGSGVPLRARTQRVRRRTNPSTEGMESSRTGFRPTGGRIRRPRPGCQKKRVGACGSIS
jgi:hypothetical protein